MTTSAYASLTADQQVFKDLFWDPLVKTGELAIESYVPAFKLPVLEQVEEGTINVIADVVFANICLLVDLAAIKLVNSAHQRAYDNASLQLKIVLVEKGVTSDDYIKARDAAATAFSNFVRFGK